mgnify:CR=1 FL=1
MSTRLLKCYGKECVEQNKKWQKEELNKISGKNYCRKHFIKITNENAERDVAYRKIAHALGIQYPTPLIKKQIKNLHDVGYDYKTISNAVDYGLQIKGYSDFSRFGIKFVEYYIEESKQLEETKPVERKPVIKRMVKFVPGKGPKKPGLFGKEWDIEKELGDIEDDGADFYKGE